MTNAPVKDVGSLLSFAGNQGIASASSVRAGATGNFGDIMNKTAYGGAGSASQGKTGTSSSNGLNGSKVNTSSQRKDTLKTDSNKKTVKPDVSAEDQANAAAGAGNEMVRQTAQELGVSEGEVRDAMEELGLVETDLLDADNLTKLVLTLSGESDSLAFLTDEGLYGKMQNLLEDLSAIQEELMKELSLSREELKQMLDGMDAKGASEGGFGAMAEDAVQKAGREEARVSITVEEGAESVKLAADENGNVIQVEEVVQKEEDSSGKQEKGSRDNENGRSGFENTNPMLDQLQKDQVPGVEASFEQMTASQTADTEKIMNQILDYMKIQLKPGMDQLEMQLHPESLGTVHVQLVSKGGEVTAQFHVQNEAVKAAMESQLTVLKESLREQGVKIEAVEVTVGSHAFESNLWQGQESNGESSYQESRKAPRRINLNALDENFEEEADNEELLAAEMMRANGGTVDYTA